MSKPKEHRWRNPRTGVELYLRRGVRNESKIVTNATAEELGFRILRLLEDQEDMVDQLRTYQLEERIQPEEDETRSPRSVAEDDNFWK